MPSNELRFKPLSRNRFLVKNIHGIGIGMICPDSNGWTVIPVRHEIKWFNLFDDAVRHFNQETMNDLHTLQDAVNDYCF